MRSRFYSMSRMAGAVTALSICCVAAPTYADVVISNAATQDMTCVSGTCSPTATSAMLNVGDLETLLASGNVKDPPTGSGGVQASNIDIETKLTWSAANTLNLDAYDSIAVAQPVSVTGMGGLSLTTNDGGSGGTFSTGQRGRISFTNLSSALTINGAPYTLVNSVKTLASAVTANASGHYALADNYNARNDGQYSNTPITTYLEGAIEGLGNTISGLHVSTGRTEFNIGGLLLLVDYGAAVENLNLDALEIKMGRASGGISQIAGGILVTNKGLLFNDHVSGKISVDAKDSGGDSSVGGLVAYNDGNVVNSSSTARIATTDGNGGGLRARMSD